MTEGDREQLLGQSIKCHSWLQRMQPSHLPSSPPGEPAAVTAIWLKLVAGSVPLQSLGWLVLAKAWALLYVNETSSEMAIPPGIHLHSSYLVDRRSIECLLNRSSSSFLCGKKHGLLASAPCVASTATGYSPHQNGDAKQGE